MKFTALLEYNYPPHINFRHRVKDYLKYLAHIQFCQMVVPYYQIIDSINLTFVAPCWGDCLAESYMTLPCCNSVGRWCIMHYWLYCTCSWCMSLRLLCWKQMFALQLQHMCFHGCATCSNVKGWTCSCIGSSSQITTWRFVSLPRISPLQVFLSYLCTTLDQ